MSDEQSYEVRHETYNVKFAELQKSEKKSTETSRGVHPTTQFFVFFLLPALLSPATCSTPRGVSLSNQLGAHASKMVATVDEISSIRFPLCIHTTQYAHDHGTCKPTSHLALRNFSNGRII